MPGEACAQIKEELVACVIRSDWYVSPFLIIQPHIHSSMSQSSYFVNIDIQVEVEVKVEAAMQRKADTLIVSLNRINRLVNVSKTDKNSQRDAST